MKLIFAQSKRETLLSSSLLHTERLHHLGSNLFRKWKTTWISFLMMTEDESQDPSLPRYMHSSQDKSHMPQTKQIYCLRPVPWDTVTSMPIPACIMAGVRNQAGRLDPVSKGNTHCWGENAKPAHFTDVAAANSHYESQQLAPFPNWHMLINPGHSDLISYDRQAMVPGASVHNQQKWRACFNLQGCKTHSMKQAGG